MEYSQSICAQNLLLALPKFDNLNRQGIKYMHLDFVDFHYSKNFGLDFKTSMFIRNRYPKIKMDGHLMVDAPYEIIKHISYLNYFFIPAKKYDELNNNENVSIFIQSQDKIANYKRIIKDKKKILIMTINKIGGTGEKLDPNLLERIFQIRKINSKIKIYTDGGLRITNLDVFKKYDPDVVVGGSIINDFNNKNFIKTFKGYDNVY